MRRFARYYLFVLLLIPQSFAFATEGMWLPQLLSSLNEKEMKSMGMKISASDIYSINKGSLKDAIVRFGGCTGEVISAEGLLLTNHHCGYGAIQSHSSIEHNYLQDGYWAQNKQAELPSPGLTATFIVRIDDITKAALKDVKPGMTEQERQSAIDRQLNEIKKNVKKNDWEDLLIKAFFEGNQYYLFITETYTDIRLVGAPPSSIGKYGADTDNWIWPRHTGDFSLFRIYAGKDNRPAPYSKDNQPLKAKHFLPISLKGVKANDFTMVFGFPGRTTEYLPSEAVKLTINVLDSSKVAIRDAALKIMDSYMRKDERLKLQYASKFASTANYWKKWTGEMQGVKQYGGIEKKLAFEHEFRKRIAAKPGWKNQYGGVLDSLNGLYLAMTPYAKARDFFSELVRNVEIFSINDRLISFLNEAHSLSGRELETARSQFLGRMKGFYQNYDAQLDKDVCAALLDLYFSGIPSSNIGGEAMQVWMEANKDGQLAAERLFGGSALVSYEKLAAMAAQSPRDIVTQLYKDPAGRLGLALRKGYRDHVSGPLNELQESVNRLQRIYMQAQMEVFSDRRFYPDANSTMRVTYGKVQGYSPRDGVQYEPYTWLEGVMEKYIPGDYEFDLPPRLIELYKARDYGPYGVNGKMPVCFIASNHTTGGNSGSPALDAYGHLVGLNFDRTWEGTMSDINYDAAICRNIMVDIRYVLFLIDKYAGAGHLIREMKLVR